MIIVANLDIYDIEDGKQLLFQDVARSEGAPKNDLAEGNRQ